MNVKQLVNFLNNKFPIKNKDSWDNVKLNSKSFLNHKIKKILIGLDLNFSMIQFAISNGANVIITHHPIFIDPNDIKLEYVKNIRKTLSTNKITHIPIHTNYDISNNSMCFQLSRIISNSKPKKPFKKSYGWIGSFDGTFLELLKTIKEKWEVDYILSASQENKFVKNFYFGSGSCGSEVNFLLHNNYPIDVYITGEIKWNIWNLGNDMNKILVDVGHNVESFFIKDITRILEHKNVSVIYDKKQLKLKSF